MDYSKQWYEHLFKDNYPLMYRMALLMVVNTDDAKDAVNQVFTQMWRGKRKAMNVRQTVPVRFQPSEAERIH